ncbi:MAG: ADP-ribosylation factor-like protein [Promethearchaeota archaeon]
MNGKNDQNIIQSIVLSIFEENGPTFVNKWPSSLSEQDALLIAIKTISLLMGDKVYQSGTDIEGMNYYGILPFPDLELNGLTYFFLIPDKMARGNAKAATITILIREENNTFFYDNMNYLRILMDETASKIQKIPNGTKYQKEMEHFRLELLEYTKNLKEIFSSSRKIKILISGLDQAGKTSFLLGVKKKYSEIIKSTPTKGISRTSEKIFADQQSIISIWDLGGQKRYREKFLEQYKVYLYNIDLLFYFIDIQDENRIEEALLLYKTLIQKLKELNEFPSIVVVLNKFDPDLKESIPIRKRAEYIKKEIKNYSDTFFVKVFETSIFDQWSLISAYSFGLSHLSPNRTLFKNQLKQLAEETNSSAFLLLNENGIILSDYAMDQVSGKVFEISAPHFQTLYKTFKEFKMLKQDFIVSSGVADEGKKIIFKRIKVGKYDLYLLFLLEKGVEIQQFDDSLRKFSQNIKSLITMYI